MRDELMRRWGDEMIWCNEVEGVNDEEYGVEGRKEKKREWGGENG